MTDNEENPMTEHVAEPWDAVVEYPDVAAEVVLGAHEDFGDLGHVGEVDLDDDGYVQGGDFHHSEDAIE